MMTLNRRIGRHSSLWSIFSVLALKKGLIKHLDAFGVVPTITQKTHQLYRNCNTKVFGTTTTTSNGNDNEGITTVKNNRTLWVDDSIECVPVTVVIGNNNKNNNNRSSCTVTVVEATAETQEALVNLALEEYTMALPTGDPYGAVLWPAARTIGEIIYNIGKDMSIIEVGTGTGLVSLAASYGGAKRIVATDYEHIPLQLLNYAATHLNKFSNDCCTIETELFNICDFKVPIPDGFDMLVAADIMYEPRTGQAMAKRVIEALHKNMHVLIGDSPGRAGRPAFLQELHKNGIHVDFTNVTGYTVVGDRHDLICGSESISVSKEQQPTNLTVAVLQLDPSKHKPR